VFFRFFFRKKGSKVLEKNVCSGARSGFLWRSAFGVKKGLGENRGRGGGKRGGLI